MKFVFCFAAVLVCALAQEFEESYLDWYPSAPQPRYRRGVGVDPNTGDVIGRTAAGGGQVSGTLGSRDTGLFGKAEYERNIFNDNRGKLDAHASGTRVLGPYGDSSHLGAGLNWSNDHAKSSFDVSKQIHGRTTYDAAAGGRWPIGKNADLSAQGFYTKTEGQRHDYGGRGSFNYRW